MNNEQSNYKQLIIDLVKNHPILLVNGFTIVGGIINLLYFFKIGYLPILKVEDTLFLFIISGFVGLIFIFLVLSYLVFPAMSYKSFNQIITIGDYFGDGQYLS